MTGPKLVFDTEDDFIAPLTWTHAAGDLLKSATKPAFEETRAANSDERAAVAQLLDLIACDRLVAHIKIRPRAGDRFFVSGTIEADIVQSCVVTLEPVPAALSESFEAEFWPAEHLEPAVRGELEAEILGDDPPEPLIDGRIETGRLVFECLATAIDPFPRRPDASLDPRYAGETSADQEQAAKPFAALARLKTNPPQ